MPDTTTPILREFHGTVAELHARAMPTDGDGAELWVMRPTASAVAMGSSQRPEQFDHQQLGEDHVELAPRRSGGGAVFIDPVATVWIDLLVSRSSPLWSSELAQNFLIVGRIWQRALGSLGYETELCVKPQARTEASALACWAGVGWGELLIGPAKIVGLSQRRTRWGSRVQAMAVIDGSSNRVANYLRAQDKAIVAPAIATHHLGITTLTLENAVVEAFGAAN